MGRWLCAAWVIGCLWLPPLAVANDDSQRELIALLSDTEWTPQPQELRSRGLASAPLLRSIYARTDQPTFVRVRALRALSYVGSDAVPTLLSVLREPHAKLVFVREAALGLPRCAGVDAVGPLAALLQRTETQLRLSAVHALAAIGSAEARAYMLQHRSTETHPAVRDALEAALLATGRTGTSDAQRL